MSTETMTRDVTTVHQRCVIDSPSNVTFESAWKNVHQHLERRARKLARGDRVAADELLADTALKALLYMRRMPHRIRNPEGFMFAVLNHVFLDSARHASREARVLYFCSEDDMDYFSAAAATAASPTHLLELDEGLTQIADIVENLPPLQHLLFSMRFEHEMSYAAISQELNISEALARKRIELLRRRLRTTLRDLQSNEKTGSRRGG
jgi:RNA polymerase sigma-70 factor (ECF subfamily)